MGRERLKKLGQLLVEFNYITEEQLKDAIAKQGDSPNKLGELLIELGYMAEEDLIQVLEFQLGVPHVKLSNYFYNPQLVQYIPENIARRYNVVPIGIKQNTLLVAMSDPSNLLAMDDIEMISGMKVEPRISSRKDIKQALHQLYSGGEDDTTEIIASLDDYQGREEPELDKLKEMVEDAPIVKLANVIISQALQSGASDIHIEPQAELVRVRFRIDGVLRENMTVPKYIQAALISRIKIIADLDITKRRIPQDGRIAMSINGMKVDLRVSTLPTIFGEKVVIRLLTKDSGLIKLDQLGFIAANYSKFKGLIENTHGIIMVTGPTGSGKTTTLFAVLNHINSIEKNIITIEDPVEYQVSGINQIQADRKTGLSFASAMRSILRQDPDIVMIGEIRDEETARIAVRAALTGHLVLSTLHTNDAISSITRLLDMGIEPYLVASTVKGVVAQRLVRRLCNNCKESYQPGIGEEQFLLLDGKQQIYRAVGCNQCNQTGYRGRLAVHEVLLVDEQIKQLIVQRVSEQEINEFAATKGMKFLPEDGIIKVKEGITSYDELVRVIV